MDLQSVFMEDEVLMNLNTCIYSLLHAFIRR